jgi:predicted ArsR family transcriptional regulator
MKRTTRYRLIEYMRDKKGVSAAELARILKITCADARHHLGCLEDEGVVVMVETRPQGRGRPTQLYRLSSDINRHNLGALTSAILNVWLAEISEYELESAYNKIAAYLTSGLSVPNRNLTQRLTNAIRNLNGMNYVARWEAHVDAPRILITHCPYASVVSERPDICRVDAYVIGKVLGQSVVKISAPRNRFGEDAHCVFRLTPGSDGY